MSDVDAVVIGAGPNGLVAANLLADRGWSILVIEEQDEPGGAVRSAEVTEPGFVSDLYSAFYPLAAVSSILHSLQLERHGVRWLRTPVVVAHPSEDGRCAALALDLEETKASLEDFAPGDGGAWEGLYAEWQRYGEALIDGLLTPFPPVRAAARLALATNRDLLRFLRMSMLPVRRLAEERFAGEGGGWLLAGNALHADLTPDSAGGGLYGLVLCGLGQQVGFPFPEGGAGKITAALVERLRSAGGALRLGTRVERVVTRGDRAVGVALAGGETIGVGKAVVATTGAPALYQRLIPREHVPPRLDEDLKRFQYDNSTVKVDWALDGPIPWGAESARRAGTVHVAAGMDGLSEMSGELVRGLIPRRPFLVVGQYSMVDPTRAPAGKEAAWAYTHVPQRTSGDAGGELEGRWDEEETGSFVERMEDEVERLAPGFRKLVRSRFVQGPHELERANQNLVGGAINGGTTQIHQQVLFRPSPGWATPMTPVRGLFLGSASAHPGGGVHGAPGANAARAAIRSEHAARRTFAIAGGLALCAGSRLGRRRSE